MLPILFFMYKPLALLLYLLGLGVILTLSLVDLDAAPFVFLNLTALFTFWFMGCVVRYYVLDTTQLENSLCGVSLKKFTSFFNAFIVVDFLALMIAGFCLLYFQRGFGVAFISIFYTVFSTLIFQKALQAKFISEMLKNNKHLKDFHVEHIYQEIRELFVNKVFKHE